MRYKFLALIALLYSLSGLAAFLIPEALGTTLGVSLAIAIGVLLVGASLQFALYHQKVAQPLERLKKALEEFKEGKPFDQNRCSSVPPEVQPLVDTLMTLIKPHQELRLSLEERNKELELKNAFLLSTNEQLEKANKTKSEFVSMVSHELRTPLAVIKGFATTLKKYAGMLPQEKVKNYYDIIDSESERLSRLISELLDISRIQEGRITLRLKKFDLQELVTSVVNNLKIKSGNVKFLVEFQKGPLEAVGDPDKVTQVLVNLLGNALKYSPSHGTITIKAQEISGMVRVQVHDEGPGIPEDYRKSVFEPFFRVDDDVNKKNPGTGLGLPISKSLIEAMGGRILAESTPPPGATFSFTLPQQSVPGQRLRMVS